MFAIILAYILTESVYHSINPSFDKT